MKIYMGPYEDDIERKISIELDPYDTWNLDHTLSLIIHPLLVQLKETKQGSPYVDDDDVPENLRSTAAAPKENDWDTDSLHFDRWDWVMDEMIWAFKQDKSDDENLFHHNTGNLKMTIDDGKLTFGIEDPTKPEYFYDKDGHKAHEARKSNGRRLFAKYYYGLWD